VGERQEREVKLKEEIRHRLGELCSNLSPAEFEELIDQIAANQLKGEYRPFRLDTAKGQDRGFSDLKAPASPRHSA
jgi:hypothetical protein